MEAERKKLAWQIGPTDARIGDKTTINVPAGHMFLDEKNTRRFLEWMGNSPQEGLYLLAPGTPEGLSAFSWNSSGYVKDEEAIEESGTRRGARAAQSWAATHGIVTL